LRACHSVLSQGYAKSEQLNNETKIARLLFLKAMRISSTTAYREIITTQTHSSQLPNLFGKQRTFIELNHETLKASHIQPAAWTVLKKPQHQSIPK
jgi:hypothetical protein